MSIKEMNKDIADFMGYEHCNRCDDPMCCKMGAVSYTTEQMKFATSWDWLMKVWFKCQDIGADIGYAFKKYHEAFHAGIDHKSITMCHKAVWEFIHWYKNIGK